MSADQQAIRELIGAWIAATGKGDVDAVLALTAEDAVFLVAGQAPMLGRDAFGASLRAVLTAHSVSAVSQVDEVEVCGDMAYSRTRLAVTVTPHDGRPPIRRSGHTLTILRKGSDGKWLLTRDANMLAEQ